MISKLPFMSDTYFPQLHPRLLSHSILLNMYQNLSVTAKNKGPISLAVPCRANLYVQLPSTSIQAGFKTNSREPDRDLRQVSQRVSNYNSNVIAYLQY